MAKTSSITFKFEQSPSALLGTMYRPVIEVKFWSAQDKKWRSVQMLMDTGADYTIIPSYVALWLGIDTSQAKTVKSIGVGGEQTMKFIPDLRVRIGNIERQIPVGIIRSTKVPPLMGRHEFIDALEITLEKRKEITVTG